MLIATLIDLLRHLPPPAAGPIQVAGPGGAYDVVGVATVDGRAFLEVVRAEESTRQRAHVATKVMR
jgi:hypothetical protein